MALHTSEYNYSVHIYIQLLIIWGIFDHNTLHYFWWGRK